MTVFQVILSISSMFLHNCISNKLCKSDLVTDDHVYRFNALSYLVCIATFAVLTLQSGLSLYTAGLGVVFGIITALTNHFKMRALNEGPMNVTLLVITCSMIIPAMSGIFFGERFSIYQFALLFVLVFFIYLSLGGGEKTGYGKSWLLFCFLAFIFSGSIGVLQKIHQSSSHKSEASGLLLVAFACSFLYSCLLAKKPLRDLHFTARHYLLSSVCGACIFAMNFLNLRLSGILPSQLFFPLVNGSAIILSTAASFLVFKERLSRKQIIGLIGGFAVLIAICFV